ncbi:YesL family protein [Halalkalibacterium halodurans]|jgi:uncharacterized membrane protein YesL|uniref:BH3684 protein n=1 Tax=Halalkalibacterium halodurans (strain ATCC BAA-125 / DSM 18197 / FERM 7344 / JCM 9153 / C-125) TaxID=272558 RepID=Q9K6P4_HALH5|nr:DUF624 domain-containing protein [Halalkalibacterium halodurans]MED3646416.1 YesL family protein [Halalkalibacterium halodurans]MED4081997.1 YesL family protein [Halalkalibacterium halodurans]MED4083621.1 YesL family protein [Halalkalibacterium halodurans]MED4106625.1 YesL family protein [Halalkalibacterium halodurans]MED4107887.1 YesL family protein [Halalkalibacterium halodurans]
MSLAWLSNGFYRACEWITTLAYLNFLWAVFTLAGGIVFGLFPATIAMYGYIRMLLQKKSPPPLFSYFWKTWKQAFVRGNLLFAIFAGAGCIIGLNLLTMQQLEGPLHTISLVGTTIASILFVIAFVYIFPVYVHYDLSLKASIYVAVFLPFSHPLTLIISVAGFLAIALLFFILPPMLPFFAASCTAFVIMTGSMFAFRGVRTVNGS